MNARLTRRDPFAVAAVFLAAVAFAGSFDHTLATVRDHGQGGWVAVATALMPEASVALSVLRIRKGGRPAQLAWAGLVLVSSAVFTLWANLEQAQPTVGGLIVGGWPAWAAIGAAGFIEMSGPARERPAVKAPRAVRQAPPASAPVVQGAEPAREPLALVQDAPEPKAGGREAVKEFALDVERRTGRRPGQTELVREGFAASTVKRALAELKEVAA